MNGSFRTLNDELVRFRSQAEAELRRAGSRESTASMSRLVIFGALVAAWIFLYWMPLAALIATAVGALAFAASIRFHVSIKERCEALRRIITICDEAALREHGAVVRIRGGARPSSVGADADVDTSVGDGKQSIADSHSSSNRWRLTSQELDDLDVFGEPIGLFGLLNRCSTAAGERRLGDALRNPMLEPSQIHAKQDAVRRLAENLDARLTLMAACAALRGEDQRFVRLVNAIRLLQPLENPLSPVLLTVWSVASALVVLAATLQSVTFGMSWFSIAIFVWIFNGATTWRSTAAARERIALFRETAWPATGFALVANCAAEQTPSSEELDTLRSRFSSVAAPDGIERLRRLAGWSEAGGIIVKLMSLTFHYELHYARALEQCVIPRREAFLAAAAAIAELEVLLSLGSFAAEQPHSCWPTVAADTCLQIGAGRHPLITASRVVANDIRLDAQSRVWVITGSNMAGKSTFLRMIGVNVLLAQCGTVVCAEAMFWCPLRLLTDLRASDSLTDGESYFLAEVRHVRRMVCAERDAHPLLGLIDEPFRGTNSQEQTAAGVAITRSLIASGQLFLVATHDRALTTLADGQLARNFHFREEVGPEGMTFDYKLRPGPATTRNALRVLERENYPASVLADAHAWLERDGANVDGRAE